MMRRRPVGRSCLFEMIFLDGKIAMTASNVSTRSASEDRRPVLPRFRIGWAWAAVVVLGALALAPIGGCSDVNTAGNNSVQQRVVDQNPSGESATTSQAAGGESVDELERALALARQSLDTLKTIRDYQCTFERQERVGGKLLDATRMEMKVRQQPFSVYMRFLEPPASAGQEVIYVAGRNDGNMLAHATGLAGVVGTVSLDPSGMIAMRGGRYPITEAGMTRLVEKLLELGAKKHLFRDSRVGIEPIEFADRPCTQVEIRNPAPVGEFRLAIARIVLDNGSDVPVHFEAFEWPPDANAEPVLVERYSYLDVRLDVGLTDLDFDPKNPAYAFP